MEIRCGSYSTKVHKAVVCTQCPYFANAVKDGRWLVSCLPGQRLSYLLTTSQEGQTGVISLPSENHAAVKALVEYLYKAEYSLPGHEQKPTLEHKTNIEQDPLLHASHTI